MVGNTLKTLWNILWDIIKKKTTRDTDEKVADLRKDVDDLKHDVLQLQRDLMNVAGQLHNIQALHFHAQLRIETLSLEFRGYKNKTDDELRSIQQFLQALTADGSELLSRVDILLKGDEVQSEFLKKQLLEQREKVVSINKRAKNNLTRSLKELNRRSAAH